MFKTNTLMEEAELFLFFVRRVREGRPNMHKRNIKCRKNNLNSKNFPLPAFYDDSNDEKYKCIYCGCEYIYRRSLISHMKRLHNLRNID